MDEDGTWRVIAQERRRLAETLAGLGSAQWESPSLCTQWRVRDVAAHLSLVGEPPPARAFVTGGLRARGNFHRLNTMMSRQRAERSTAELVDSLLRHAESRAVPAVTNYRNVLFDVLVHVQDVAYPLGLELPVPVAGGVAGLERVWSMGWPFHARRRLAGLQLVAADADWAAGAGPELRGSVGELLLLATGRPAALDRMTGPGVVVARERLAAAR